MDTLTSLTIKQSKYTPARHRQKTRSDTPNPLDELTLRERKFVEALVTVRRPHDLTPEQRKHWSRRMEAGKAAYPAANKNTIRSRTWEMMQRPRVLNAIAYLRQQNYQTLGLEAQDVIRDIVESRDVSTWTASVIHKAASDILDRAGDRAMQKIEVKHELNAGERLAKILELQKALGNSALGGRVFEATPVHDREIVDAEVVESKG